MAKTKDNTTLVSRPRRKPDSSTKGRMNEWDNGYKEFVPTGTRESNRKMLKQLGNSSFYKSEGTKESSYSLHLNVDAKDCEDPVAALHEQFMVLTAEQQKQKPSLSEVGEGRMLYDNGESLQVWLDSVNGEVSILTKLTCSPQIERQLLQLQGDMARTLGRYHQEIINANK